MIERQPASGSPLRYGLADLLALVLAVNLHAFVFNLDSGDSETGRIVAAVLLGMVFATGSAYLTHRLCTENRIESFWSRLFIFIVLDLALLSCVSIVPSLL
ncbi:MAG: hypothetical protein M5U26_02710 [Planctomycetota bacterium]|nr:hypothetical protein [Planctomycetota bacterium]